MPLQAAWSFEAHYTGCVVLYCFFIVSGLDLTSERTVSKAAEILLTQLRARQPVQADSALCRLYREFPVHLGRDPYHEFPAIVFVRDWLGDRLAAFLHILNDICNHFPDAPEGGLGCTSEPA